MTFMHTALHQVPRMEESQSAPASAPSAPAAAGADGLRQALARSCRRLRDVLRQENAILRRGGGGRADIAALAETARQKDMLQLDIMRLVERGGITGALHEEMQDALREELAELRAALDDNARLLELHLQAARELAAHLEHGIRRHASDGTYTPGSLRAAGNASARGPAAGGNGGLGGSGDHGGNGGAGGEGAPMRGYGAW